MLLGRFTLPLGSTANRETDTLLGFYSALTPTCPVPKEKPRQSVKPAPKENLPASAKVAANRGPS